jgi:hypothetical protein
MHSEAFATNPLGVDIDPDVLPAQYRDGASAEQLLPCPLGRQRRFRRNTVWRNHRNPNPQVPQIPQMDRGK